MIFTKKIDSPLGKIILCQQDDALCALHFDAEPAGEVRDTPLLLLSEKQLQAYFAGELRQFDLPLAPRGTPFQRSVWQALTHIPYGEVRTYGDIAREIGRPKAFRAVGMANHVNPLPILIPCHRVVGAGGKLTGYAYGLELKEKLLKLENAALLPYVKLTSGAAK